MLSTTIRFWKKENLKFNSCMTEINIAVLLTCFNRKDLTISCLSNLKHALLAYNSTFKNNICISVFLTNDGCTDGTPEAVRQCLEGEVLHIIEADGNAYWAGGMRLAWECAIKNGSFDFFLLLNDDTDVWNNLFEELFAAHDYCKKMYSKGGVYSGNTTWKSDYTKRSFGGRKASGFIFKRFYRLYPNGVPQRCDIVNANILMVSREVVDAIGIFPKCYWHGAADNDYGMRANKAGFPVVITSGYCGSCDADNYNLKQECAKISNMTFSQRAEYFSKPTHSVHDQLEFSMRWRKVFVPVILFAYFLHRYIPSLYAFLLKKS